MSVISAKARTGSIRTIATDIKLGHSVFALPFALLAAFMAVAPLGASIDWMRFGGQVVLVVLAMVFARTFAMLANRLLDRDLDARNPRTATRAIPGGRLDPAIGRRAMLACAILFAGVCALFGVLYGNWWPLALAAPVLAWIGAYPLLKRFTAACHLYLGTSLAISPLAAALAVEPASLATQPALWWLAGMVLLWVAGFDVIYALQDIEVDREQGLHSLPSRLGATGARAVSAVLHAGAAACLVTTLVVDPRLGALFGAGVAAVIGLLLLEHLTVARWGTSRIALTFFTLNGVISCALGTLGIADVLV
jgi:4-hydroxybenzoate polyprenyltransferase